MKARLGAAIAGAAVIFLAAGAGATDRAVCFLFDTSGSLSPPDLERGREFARQPAATLGPDAVAGGRRALPEAAGEAPRGRLLPGRDPRRSGRARRTRGGDPRGPAALGHAPAAADPRAEPGSDPASAGGRRRDASPGGRPGGAPAA